ncbi:MAG: RtcB family protein [Desulfovibrio sp.]|jgi:hypothetical protein|nr:RtcB family protein [Desulfovibrio sp.]
MMSKKFEFGGTSLHITGKRITGKHNTAQCFTGEIESSARSQIQAVCVREEFADSKIRIMPDVHAGMGCVIGTTMTITDKIVPL